MRPDPSFSNGRAGGLFVGSFVVLGCLAAPRYHTAAGGRPEQTPPRGAEPRVRRGSGAPLSPCARRGSGGLRGAQSRPSKATPGASAGGLPGEKPFLLPPGDSGPGALALQGREPELGTWSRGPVPGCPGRSAPPAASPLHRALPHVTRAEHARHAGPDGRARGRPRAPVRPGPGPRPAELRGGPAAFGAVPPEGLF